MKLYTESYIHNRIILDEREKQLLRETIELIEVIHESNQDNGATDDYLYELCNRISTDIRELFNYSNEYPNN